MKLGVIIPSRLTPRPGGRLLRDFGPELWLDGAMASVMEQRGLQWVSLEIYVGVDRGVVIPLHIYDNAVVVRGTTQGQSFAVNAAAEMALLDGCDVLAFLEDDDRWHPRKCELMLPHLETAHFVSCSQQLVQGGDSVGINDYPVPSGWMMPASLWKQVGGFDTSYRWMFDMEWLGRLNARKVSRVHLTNRGLPRQGKLGHVALHAEVVTTDIPELLVIRSVNPDGGMVTIEKGGVAAAEATVEVAKIRERFGNCPW